LAGQHWPVFQTPLQIVTSACWLPTRHASSCHAVSHTSATVWQDITMSRRQLVLQAQ
jgi:hypothetical protein